MVLIRTKINADANATAVETTTVPTQRRFRGSAAVLTVHRLFIHLLNCARFSPSAVVKGETVGAGRKPVTTNEGALRDYAGANLMPLHTKSEREQSLFNRYDLRMATDPMSGTYTVNSLGENARHSGNNG